MGANEFKLRNNSFRVQMFSPKVDLIKLFGCNNLIVDFNWVFFILKLKMRDIAGQALAFVQDLVKALLNFHTYTEQRIQIFPIDSAIDTISPLNQKVRLTQDAFCLP